MCICSIYCVLIDAEVRLLSSTGLCLMQVRVCARMCVTALHALDLQLANNALGPHSCLIITVHRDPLAHTHRHRHTQCERLSHSYTGTDTNRHTQTYADIHRDTHPFPQAPH